MQTDCGLGFCPHLTFCFLGLLLGHAFLNSLRGFVMGECLLLGQPGRVTFCCEKAVNVSFSDSGEATEGGAGGSCLFRPFPGVVFRGSPPHLRRRHLHPRTRPAGPGPQAAPRGGCSHHPGTRMGRTGEVPGRSRSRDWDDTSFFLVRRCAPPVGSAPFLFPGSCAAPQVCFLVLRDAQV